MTTVVPSSFYVFIPNIIEDIWKYTQTSLSPLGQNSFVLFFNIFYMKCCIEFIKYIHIIRLYGCRTSTSGTANNNSNSGQHEYATNNNATTTGSATILSSKSTAVMIQSFIVRNQDLYHTKHIFYIMISFCIVFWPLYNPDHWTWCFNCIVPASMLVRFLYKGFIVKDSEDMEVQMYAVSSTPSELLFGPVQFTGILLYLGIYHFMTSEAIVIVSAVGIGDTLASIIGKWYGRRHMYQINPLSTIKTIEGSVGGVLLGTILAIYTFYYYTTLECIRPVLPLGTIVAYAAVAAITEATSPSNIDKLFVTTVLLFSKDRIQQLLPD